MDETSFSIATVIVDLAIKKKLDYLIPPPLRGKVQKGMRVKVPIRKKEVSGIVFALKEKSEYPSLAELISISDKTPFLDDALYQLAIWLAQYYNTDLNKVLGTMLPSSIRKEVGFKEQLYIKRAVSKKILQKECAALQQTYPSQAKILEQLLLAKQGLFLTELLEKSGCSKSPILSLEKKGLLTLAPLRKDRLILPSDHFFKSEKKELTEEQKIAFDAICNCMQQEKFHTFLLFGVTGSGKTEIYLQAIEKVLEQNKSALLLVPEIALTEQMILKFQNRFDKKIAVLHHRLSDGERFDEWHKLHNQEAMVCLAARSGVFAPLKNLGLIIVDEEHENAYKQDDGFCYHARDVAVMRAKLNQACCILGSATPSIESMYNAEQNKYTLLTLKERAQNAKLASVQIVDMQKEREKKQTNSLFSQILLDKIEARLKIGEQTILFLNRRGFHTSLVCNGCKKSLSCPNCAMALTFHRSEEHLACHLCDYRLKQIPKNCSTCGEGEILKFQGVGTEKLELGIRAVFPQARTLRIDSDTTAHKGSLEKLLRDFRTHKADILIGTQMIAKGLHFPAVTLVAVIFADAGLHIPDFRASEKVFQLICQVAGRSGRAALAGEVILQSFLPEISTIQTAANQDYLSFYKEELEARKLFDYPPFSRLVKCTFSGKEEKSTLDFAIAFRKHLLTLLGNQFTIFPLVPCGYAKIKEKYRFQFLIKGPMTSPICLAINQTKGHTYLGKECKLKVDVDPISTFF